MKKILSIFATAAILCALSGCGENEPTTEITTTAPQQTTTSNTTSAAPETDAPETTLTETEESEEPNIKLVSHSLSNDYSGAEALILEFEWTNTDEKEANFMTTFTASVYQNGIECESAIMVDGVDSQLLMNDIKPGVTYKVKKAYVLQDNTTANVIVRTLFGKDDLVNENIDLGGGAGADPTVSTAENSVKIVNHKLSTDYNGDEVLVVDYEFCNGEKEAKAFMFIFSDKAFQNGVECDSTVIGCDDIDSQKLMNEVQPGVTYTVSVGYHIADKSDVEIEVKSLFGSTTYLTETISLA